MITPTEYVPWILQTRENPVKPTPLSCHIFRVQIPRHRFVLKIKLGLSWQPRGSHIVSMCEQNI